MEDVALVTGLISRLRSGEGRKLAWSGIAKCHRRWGTCGDQKSMSCSEAQLAQVHIQHVTMFLMGVLSKERSISALFALCVRVIFPCHRLYHIAHGTYLKATNAKSRRVSSQNAFESLHMTEYPPQGKACRLVKSLEVVKNRKERCILSFI
jgi:hypothetical protein